MTFGFFFEFLATMQSLIFLSKRTRGAENRFFVSMKMVTAAYAYSCRLNFNVLCNEYARISYI